MQPGVAQSGAALLVHKAVLKPQATAAPHHACQVAASSNSAQTTTRTVTHADAVALLQMRITSYSVLAWISAQQHQRYRVWAMCKTQKRTTDLGQGCLQRLSIALQRHTDWACVLLHAFGSSLRHAHTAQVVPVLTHITADHGRVHIVRLLAHA